MGQAFLINSPPEVMLFTINLDKNLINEESIAKATMFSLQLSRVFRAKSIAPQSNRLVGNIYPTLC